MVIRLKKNPTQKQLKEVLGKVKVAPKPFDISRFAGALTWGKNAVEFQRELRSDD
ncbi:hypothetical protein [uncultured Fibrella sp.]|uniref:hypothetical protein n=1 Tax=uncultured Fibrella sp. TaxID=1284596 RepID=UPI0035CB20F9